MKGSRRKFLIIFLLASVIALPFVMQKKTPISNEFSEIDEKIVVVTPHIEAIRYEFTEGFKKWYHKKTGKAVDIDWRVLGGTQEVIRYINSAYANAFELYWERNLGNDLTMQVRNSFSNPKIELGNDPASDTFEQQVRRAFLSSNVSCGIDIIFGGGEVEIKDQAARGQIVHSEIIERQPEWFDDGSIPEVFKGCVLWDKDGLWLGASHSSFGIIFNQDCLEKIGINKQPDRWIDLTDSAYLGEVAMADPTISSSCMRVFEMIVQEYANRAFRSVPNHKAKVEDLEVIWDEAFKHIQLFMANARYFTDSSTKPVLDVAAGDCAAGVAIDSYGMYQEENLRARSGSNRFNFVEPKGGSSVTPDPIALLRGAPNKELAEAFIEYVLSMEGQKLWGFKAGAPGGPKRYVLSRSPARKEVYSEEYKKYRTNPDLNPYASKDDFVYRPEWTATLFKEMRFVMKAAFIDPHAELVEAWTAIIDARKAGKNAQADEAFAVMQDLERIDYNTTMRDVVTAVHSGDHLQAIKLQTKLSRDFRKQYKKATQIASAR